jgi:hypothetical protein
LSRSRSRKDRPQLRQSAVAADDAGAGYPGGGPQGAACEGDAHGVADTGDAEGVEVVAPRHLIPMSFRCTASSGEAKK